MRRQGYGLGIVLCLLLLVLSGCGRKTPPVPPLAAIPVPITDLKETLDDKNATLSWTYPTLSEGGDEIANIRVFQLFKSEVPAADYCEGCPVQYGTIIKLSTEGVKPGSRVRYTDTDLKNHYRYAYKVVSRSGWNIASRDSNRVSFWWESPLLAPAGLSLQVAGEEVTVQWQPVDALRDGSSVAFPVLYQVYRSDDGREFSRIGAPVKELSYVDQDLKTDRKYYYKVQALRTLDGTKMFGEMSEVVAGQARDLTPPAPPHKFMVVATEDGVKVLWENVAEDDVAGYRIYRRQSGQQDFAQVGETVRSAFFFVDRELPPGRGPLYYAVTAFDNADPPNESVMSKVIELIR